MKLNRLLVLTLLFSMMIFLLAACGGKSEPPTQPTASNDGSSSAASGMVERKGPITIGGKDFTEQQILAKITSIYLKENGYDVTEAINMGSTVVRSALENGQIDMYWEYTGTALVLYQKQEIETNPDLAYEKVKENDQQNKLIWLDRGNFNNTYGLLMRQELAEELGIKSISDLAKFVNNDPEALKFASNAEFYAREDGMKGVQAKYGFEFPAKNVTKMDTGLLYSALKDGLIDVSVGFATDGRIKGFDLVLLEDDQFFFPAYHGVPVIREEVFEKNPEIADLLSEVAAKLDDETMRTLNYTVDVEHKDIAEVAREWLISQQLIN